MNPSPTDGPSKGATSSAPDPPDYERASFITQTIPRITRRTHIVGLCTVPECDAGMGSLGWHIVDFLSWRWMLHNEYTIAPEIWLSACDIPRLLQGREEEYFGPRGGRDLSIATLPHKCMVGPHRPETWSTTTIEVWKDGMVLKRRFVQVLENQLSLVKRFGREILIIICGFTTPERDIFFVGDR